MAIIVGMIIACALIGIAAGTRFRVLIIIPLTAIAATAVGAIAAAIGEPTWAIIGAMIASAIGLQIGYLGGSLVVARTRNVVQPPMPQTSQDRNIA